MLSHKRLLANMLLAGALMLTSVASPAPVSATVAPSVQAAAVHYAKPGGTAEGNCDSWNTACDLWYALGTVAGAGDEIWVARGVYTPGTTISATFALTDGVALYGGFAMTETVRTQRNWSANVTTLSGDIDGNDITDANGVVTDPANIRGNNAYHVVTGSGVTNTAVLNGFMITGGNANGGTYQGGGMYTSNGSPTLTKIIFSGNSAYHGGGMYNENSNPVLTNIAFNGNFAGNGGGIKNADSSPLLTNVTFSNNSAFAGGGMYSYGNSGPLLTNVTFSGNSATSGSGGGMYNSSSNPTLTNVTFSGNSATNGGGGISNADSSNPIVRNTLLVKGAAGGNCVGDGFAAGSTANLDDDTSCGWTAAYSTHIKLGPLGDYGGSTQTVPLLPGSAAIDAGSATYCPATDQRGYRRVGRCDIGAYEAPGWIFLPGILKLTYFEGPFESEDNDTFLTANGLLRFGQNYYAAFNDERDYFSVYLPAAGQISVDVTHSSSAVQLQLFYQVADEAHRVAADTTGRRVTYTGVAGVYYIYVYTASLDSSAYTLRVTYP